MADAEEQEHAMRSLLMLHELCSTIVLMLYQAQFRAHPFVVRYLGTNGRRKLIYSVPVAMLALLLLLPSAHAADFGRLFFTPEQRAQLDYDYTRNVSAEGNAGSVVMVNGIVQRRGGGRIVWINGMAQPAGKSDERHPTSVPVSVPGKSRPVEMKVGQKLLLNAPETTPDTSPK